MEDMSIKSVLARYRDEKGCSSNEELAEKTGLDLAYLEGLEAGTRTDLKDLLRRAVEEDLNIFWLKFGQEPRYWTGNKKAPD